MTELHNRFKALDDMPTPNLWHEVEERAVVAQPTPGRVSLVLIAVMLLVALAIGGAVLVGSGIVQLPPVSVDASRSPEPSPKASAIPASPSPAPATATWAATGGMLEARAGNTATLLLDGKVLVAGGETGGSVSRTLASAELYDPLTGTWSATGTMSQARTGHSAVMLPDGKVLVVGGASMPTNFPSDLLASAELYDPLTGTWTVTGSLHAVRQDHAAFLLPDGTVLVVGGSDGSEDVASDAVAERYEPDSGTWTVTANLIEAFYVWAATSLSDGKVLVVGGPPDEVSPAELYDPVREIWSATGNVIEPYCFPVGGWLLRTGKVLLICGPELGSESPASGELYDPANGTWAVTGSMHGEIVNGGVRAVQLADGRVLAVTFSFSDAPPSAELYDPITGSWTATASMEVWGQGTLLRDGTVLFAGGGNGTGVVASAALYEPGGGS